ncbi:MAG: haloacid dehalogenase-like hydrolase [Acidobacteria bacterium]|nr:haloacid dehalogenase-like hydrolase [Acidobacteriota bacterium]
MTVLFWDIDGTLLTTARAGVFAWEDAVRELIGREFELASTRIAGMTDFQIAERTFQALGVEADEAFLRRFVDRYGALLPSSLPRKQGSVMPNVREILERLRDRSDVRSYLLTGNTRAGAHAKLTHYNLLQYFPDGAFAEDTSDRSSIARRALALARVNGEVDEGRMFVIGDTPHDVECARSIDARTIAVATGGYTFDELEAHEPWCVLRELPTVDEFVKLIDVGASGGPSGATLGS